MKKTPTLLAISVAMALGLTVYANETPHVTLEALSATVTHPHTEGETIYNAEQLTQTPTANKTITEVLKWHPNVQFDKAHRSAGTQGELSAGDFSINGALFYDNKILLNNVNIANTINPAGNGNNPSATNSLPATSQDVTVNTDLLCQLEVLDSNVSAEHGGFVGGVVKAKTCRPTSEVGKLHGNISYDYTSSDWTKFNPVSQEELDNFESNTSTDYQKEFKKQGVSATLYGNPSERLGVQLSASHRWSDINLKSTLADARPYNQERTADNVMLDLYHDIDNDNKVKLSLSHNKTGGLYYQSNVADSNMDIKTKTHALDLSFEHHLNKMLLTHGLVYSQKQQSRTTTSDQSVPWRSSPAKNWSSSTVATEGTAGAPLEHNGKTLEYHIKSVFDKYQKGNFGYQAILGVNLGKETADWKRPNGFYQYFVPSSSGGGGTDCIRTDGTTDPYCDSTYQVNGVTVGQYHTRRSYYQAGQVNVRQTRWSAYLENHLNFGDHIKSNLGIRFDKDNLARDDTLAPRLKITYYPFGNETLAIDVGRGRYYGRNAFNTALQDGINKLSWTQTRTDINSGWITMSNVTNTNVRRNELATPYADENVVAIFGQAYNTAWQLKYIHRDYKDQIRYYRESLSPLVWSYDNLGQSRAKNYSLTLSTISPLDFIGANHHLYFGADFSDVYRNFNDYDDSTLNEDKYILYDGQVIANIDRPANNYNQPKTYRLGINSKLYRVPLNINNNLRYRTDYHAMVASFLATADRFYHDGELVRTAYTRQHIGGALEWDIKTQYTFGQKQQTVLGMTVNNVLNRKNKYPNGSTVESEVGRQYLAELNFKF
ncbi:MAG: Plug domain-containing protein [Moraxella sp.]|nr:Plug domain-containing protein [Moraxella sp.]